MSWFDEQIRQRKINDEKIFAESLKEAAGAVLGRPFLNIKDERILTGSALEKILRYYHMSYRESSRQFRSLEEQLEYILHPQGMMYRKVKLEPGWQWDAVGAYLGFRKDTGSPVALIPSKLIGYRCYDAASNDSFFVTKKSSGLLKEEAYCFYRPFPQENLSIPRIARYILESLRVEDFVLIFGITYLTILVGFLLPRLTNLLYGTVLEKGEVSVLIAMAVFMLCVRASRLLIETGGNLISGCVQTRLQLGIQSAAMMRVLSLPPGFFRKYSSGELSARMQSVDSLCMTLVDTVLRSGLTSLASLLYVTQIFRYAPELVIPSLLIIASTIVFSTVTMILETKRQKRIMEEEARMQGISFALIGGIQKIRLAGAEKRTFAHWAKTFNKTAELKYNPPMILKIRSTILEGINLFGTVVLYAIALAGSVSLKDYMAFNQAYGMVMGAFASLVSTAMVLARIKPVLDMAKPILETKPETSERKTVVQTLKGNIELNNVTFRYKQNGPKIVDNMSLKIKAGEYVAIVGPSGCGKSTLVRLLLGFEKPELGGIFYDGKNLDQIDLKSLREKIGTVTQNGGLFNDSIFNNIALSSPGLTMEGAWKAAETACVADDIRAMPMGMFTMISEGQGSISGGQKQRLMIARAIASHPSILIFDEATSALDNITQKKITKSLDSLQCTRVVIAHRLSTIRSCQRILYLGDGKVLEEGTYDELMAKQGLFASMVARQQV